MIIGIACVAVAVDSCAVEIRAGIYTRPCRDVAPRPGRRRHRVEKELRLLRHPDNGNGKDRRKASWAGNAARYRLPAQRRADDSDRRGKVSPGIFTQSSITFCISNNEPSIPPGSVNEYQL